VEPKNVPFDVSEGSNESKLQFTIFVPTSDFLATVRSSRTARELRSPSVEIGG
jgi:hypothetical protein